MSENYQPAMSLRVPVAICVETILRAIARSWSVQTAAPGTYPDGVTDVKPGVPSRGQCAVTALLAQDIFGGEIVRGENVRTEKLPDGILRETVVAGSHYWNRIPGMGDLDLTLDQYRGDVRPSYGQVVPRSRLIVGERAEAARTLARYAMLRTRFQAELAL